MGTEPNEVAEKRVLIVGGSSGIGRSAAELFLRAGAEVWICGRTEAKLQASLAHFGVGDRAHGFVCDTTDEQSVEGALARFPDEGIDYLIITASSAVHGPTASLAITQAQGMFEAKFWGPYRTVKAALAKLRDGGSVTLFSGVLSRRPGLNCAALGAVNAAVEGLTRGLALELGPRLRVNCVSPGMVRTEAYARLPEEKRQTMYRETGASLPLGRVGEAEEIAHAVLFAATNPYFTGQVLDVDGGHMIRQYATR